MKHFRHAATILTAVWMAVSLAAPVLAADGDKTARLFDLLDVLTVLPIVLMILFLTAVEIRSAIRRKKETNAGDFCNERAQK